MIKLGATGDFPAGKFNNDDEGGLRIAIAIKDKTILIDFGKDVAWLGLDADTAESLARTLLENVKKIRNKLT